MTQAYRIRSMALDEMAIALDWAAAEGWNPGLHDAPCFHAADPGAFLLGLLDGEPVATISVVRYGTDVGFLGFYIVKPGFRGRGLGLGIWQAGMERLAGRQVGLDGVPAQQDNYRKSGFTLAWRNVRHEGPGGGEAARDDRIVALDTLPFEVVRSYDQPFFPADRSAFLRCWLRLPASTALGYVDGGTLKGYGVLRACRDGHKIGPLFADDAQIADKLLAALAAGAEKGATVALDTPEANPQAIALARRHGMKAVFETARMYTGPRAPALPMGRFYGVTSYELG
jgi:ribosomal protein S18 acetylase RimI-like enzyme